MKFKLKKLRLLNFKKIRSLEVDFDQTTNILGPNEAGKTTLMDSFLWLFFDKDSSGKTSFSVKTLDINNQPFHHLEHEVTAWVDLDGREIVIRKVLKEKWTKPKGQKDEVFDGHTKAFYWDEVPMKENEYQVEVSKIINESLFRLLSDTTYFNSLKWEDRRNVLLQISGTIDDSTVLDKIATIQNKYELGALVTALNQGKTIEQYKKQIAGEIKSIKDEMEMLPSRIDEATRSLPDPQPYDELTISIEKAQSEVKTIDAALLDKSNSLKAHHERIYNLVNQKQNYSRLAVDIEYSERNKVETSKRERQAAINNKSSEISSKSSEIDTATRDLNRFRSEYTSESDRKDRLSNEVEVLRSEYAKVDGEILEFKEGQFHCPTCQREFEASNVDSQKTKLRDNFNLDKSTRLAQIKSNADSKNNEIALISTKLGNLKADADKLKLHIENLNIQLNNLQLAKDDLIKEDARLSSDDELQYKNNLTANTEYNSLKDQIGSLELEINKPLPIDDEQSKLTERKTVLNSSISEWSKLLASKEQREKIELRITELKNSERALAEKLASTEGIDFLIEQFSRTQMNELERRVNSRFNLVKFKMFKEQVNGGKADDCITLVNGVPYADVNTAGKIQAGLDIINTLSQHYKIIAPVWVDFRESVTKLPATDCQLISLIVDSTKDKLTIEHIK